jgi:hypothetical protein
MSDTGRCRTGVLIVGEARLAVLAKRLSEDPTRSVLLLPRTR